MVKMINESIVEDSLYKSIQAKVVNYLQGEGYDPSHKGMYGAFDGDGDFLVWSDEPQFNQESRCWYSDTYSTKTTYYPTGLFKYITAVELTFISENAQFLIWELGEKK